MNRCALLTRLAFASVAMVLVGPGSLVLAQDTSGERITPNFRNTDISQIAEAVQMVTHKTIIMDPRVRAQVTIYASMPMTPDAFYQTFLNILQVHSFVAVQQGAVVKVIPDVNQRYMPGINMPDHVSSTSDEIVTQVLQVKNVSAAQLVPVLRPLVPPQGDLTAYPQANILIISDRAANVSRIMQIVERIDQSDTSDDDVMPMQNASADVVARIVNSIFQGQGQNEVGTAPLKIVSDERSNSILLSGDATARLRAKAIIAHLDTPAAEGGDTEVRPLYYEDAKKLAPLLKQQITGMEQAQGGSTQAGTAASQPGKATEIWADEQNNALVITAPPKLLRDINSIVDRLDIRRAQVLVQAIIVDVDFDKATELGVNWAVYSQGSTVPGATFLTPVGGASLVDLAESIINPSNLPSTGLVNGTTVALGSLAKTGISFAAMLRALQTNDDSNIIATPTTVTMDHQEAKIEVAEQVPFVTGQYTNTSTATAGTVTPFQTIQSESVGTILKITPDITNDNLILKIDIESSSVIPTSTLEAEGQSGSTVNPTTQKRTVTTQVLIKDGETLVIGGLISNEYDRNQTGVPLLSHIPVLGQLFSDRQGTLQKKDMMIFIKATILHDSAEAGLATDAKYQFIRKEQEAVGSKELIPLVPGAHSSVLPPPTKGVPASNFEGCCDIEPLTAPPPPGSDSAPHPPQANAASHAAPKSGTANASPAAPQGSPAEGSPVPGSAAQSSSSSPGATEAQPKPQGTP